MKEIYHPPGVDCTGCRLKIGGRCRCPMDRGQCDELSLMDNCQIEVDIDELEKKWGE